jgi:hypothetical protein
VSRESVMAFSGAANPITGISPISLLPENRRTFQELRATPLQLLNPANRPCNHLEVTHETFLRFSAWNSWS